MDAFLVLVIIAVIFAQIIIFAAFFSKIKFSYKIKTFFNLLIFNKYEEIGSKISFKTFPKEKWGFADHYKQHILPHVKIYEAKRIEALKEFRKRCLIYAPIAVCFFGFSISLVSKYYVGGDQIKPLVSTLGFITIMLIAIVYYPISKYKISVKTNIFPNVFSYLGNGFKFSEISSISASKFMDFDVIPRYTLEQKEDYISGYYKEVKIEMFETQLKSGTGKSTETIFQGLIILLNLNKNFSGKTIVRSDYGKVFNLLMHKSTKLELVKLEDPVFEKKFQVHSTDQVEARYLLTTSFMERLLSLENVFKTDLIECSFYNNKLLLMIPSNKNRFETSSIFTPATFIDDIREILLEMDEIFKIIDILKLNEKTGL